MTEMGNKIEYSKALEDFRRARAKARVQHLWAAVTGESLNLWRFDEINQKLHTLGLSSKGLKEIPLNAIVGSVNRYQDFNKNFLPLHDVDSERWANVKAAMTSPGSTGLPPIIVYKIGDTYFVLDGNHRVSIAKQMGIEKIEAYVTEINTRVPLSPNDTPEDIIIKAEYSDFLEKTKIDRILPNQDFKVTFPGSYPILEEHIHVHRHYMGLEQQREIPWEEAVLHWFETVYHPVVETIREQNLLKEFPGNTVTDLYIWILDHQSYLQERMGWEIRPEKAAKDLLRSHSRQFLRAIKKRVVKIINKISKPGITTQLISEQLAPKTGLQSNKMFSDMLVPFSGKQESWVALEQALKLAVLENADVRGLVVKKAYDMTKPTISDEEILHHFSERLEKHGIHGNLVFAQGNIAETIYERAKVNDLVILKLNHPPSTNLFARLRSGMRKIVSKTISPLMFVRDELSPMNHILLAYDGSPKGKQALYIAAYLSSRYEKQLSVLVVSKDEHQGQLLLSEAIEYLGTQYADKINKKPVSRTDIVILQVAEERGADLIIMGGYGLSPMLEIFLGSTVDGVLRGTHVPVIVAQ